MKYYTSTTQFNLYVDFHPPCLVASQTGRCSRLPPGRGAGGGAGALVFNSNRITGSFRS
jgi:hypothetical protein